MSKLIKKCEHPIFKFELYDDCIIYKRTNSAGNKFIGALTGYEMLKSDINQTIFLKDITDIEIKKTTWLEPGYFRIKAGGVTQVEIVYIKDFCEKLQEDINKIKNDYSQRTNIASGKSDLNDLEKLAELKSKGIITEEEFQAKKKQILGL